MRTSHSSPGLRLAPLAALLLVLLPPARGQEPPGGFDSSESPTYVKAFDDDMNGALRKAAAPAAAGDFEKAAALYQEAAEKATDQVVRVRSRTFLGVREYVKSRLRAWPLKGLEAYRKLTDSRAGALYRRSLETGSPAGLVEISRRFVMSSFGARALLALGTRALARGDADSALRYFLEILQIHGEGEIPGVRRADLLARAGLAAAKQGDRLLLDEIRGLAAALPAGTRVEVAGEPRSLVETLAALTPRPAGETAPEGWTTLGGSPSRSGGREGPRGPLALYWVWPIPEAGSPTDEEENSPYSPLLPVHPLIAGDLLVVTGHRVLEALRLPPADFAPTRESLIGLAPEVVFTYGSDETEPDMENCCPGQPPAPATAAGGLLLLPFRDVYRRHGDYDFSDRSRKTTFVSLSLAGQGRKLDQRGGEEVDEDNARMFEGVQFCGAPLVVGDRVYTAATRADEDEEDEGVETLLFCFDLSSGPGRLRPLWSTFLCQGVGERHVSEYRWGEDERVQASSVATRNGLLYVVSNTGAVAALDAATGDPVWIHTYEQANPNPHLFGRETRPLRTWFPCPPMLDHRFVWAVPEDSDRLLVYHQRPPLASGLLLADEFGRDDIEAGFDPEYLLGVRDGVAFLAGTSRNGAEPPLFAVKHGPSGPGDPTRILWRAEIEEEAPRGRGVVAKDAIYFGTEKGIYRVSAKDGGVTKLVDPRDDRIAGLAAGREVVGNLAVSGRWLVSASEELICLFGPAPPAPPAKRGEPEKDGPEKEE